MKAGSTERENVDPNDGENGSVRVVVAELYWKGDCALGEGPVWHDETLYWTDITGKAFYTRRDDGSVTEKFTMPFEVGSFVLWKNNALVLATEKGFQSFNLKTRKIEAWCNPEKDLPDNRFNDGKCDPRGRFIAGTLNRVSAPEAALYLLDHDHSVRELFRPLTCSNGLAWSSDGSVFYHIDTPTGVVRAFNYDLATGRLSGGKVVVEIPPSQGKPDGMTIDRDGNLWIALWNGWGVECWNPNTGKKLARIELPVAQVTSCTFGGHDLKTLFITSARTGLSESDLAEQELAGSIFCAQPNATGFAVVPFKSNP